MVATAAPDVALEKFTDRLPIRLHQVPRAAVQIGNLDAVYIDAELTIESRKHLLHVDGAIDRVSAGAIRVTDDLSGPQPATGNQY